MLWQLGNSQPNVKWLCCDAASSCCHLPFPASCDLRLHFCWYCHHIDCKEPSLPGFHQWPGTGSLGSAWYTQDTRDSLLLATQKLKAWVLLTPLPAAESDSDWEELGPLFLNTQYHTAQTPLKEHEVNQATMPMSYLENDIKPLQTTLQGHSPFAREESRSQRG